MSKFFAINKIFQFSVMWLFVYRVICLRGR